MDLAVGASRAEYDDRPFYSDWTSHEDEQAGFGEARMGVEVGAPSFAFRAAAGGRVTRTEDEELGGGVSLQLGAVARF